MVSGILEPVVAVLLPGIVTGAVAGALIRVRAPRNGTSRPSLGWEGVALCVSIAIATCLLRGWNGFPPANANDWPLFLALPAAVLVLCAGRGRIVRVVAAIAFVAIALPAAICVRPNGELPPSWSGSSTALIFSVLGLAWIGLILAAQRTAVRLPTATLPAWAGALAVAGFIVADRAASIQHGQLSAGVGVAAGIVAILALLFRDRLHTASIAIAIAAMVPIWWLLAHALSYNSLLPLLALAPLALAPIAGAWASWPFRQRPWLGAIVAAIVAATIAAIAMSCLPDPKPTASSGW